MLRDITIGQYFPGNSIIHRIDPRFKIIITAAFIVMLFSAAEVIALLPGILFIIMSFMLSGLPAKMVVKGLKPVVPILIFTSVFNLFFVPGNEIFRLGFIKITTEGIELTIFMLLRIFFLIAGTSLLTYTSSPIELTDAIERIFNPLKKLRLPVHELAMMMTIALRFIPTLIEETDKIMSAQKARGADLESGSIIQRSRALVPIMIPLIVSAFRRAEELALAMDCRCYHGGEGRTRLKQLKSGSKDIAAVCVTFIFLALVFVINYFFKDFTIFSSAGSAL